MILFLPLAACDTLREPELEDVLRPLAVGNYWRYHYYAFPAVTKPDSVQHVITREVIVDLGDQQVRSFARSSGHIANPNPPPAESLEWNGPDGLYVLGAINDSDTLVANNLWLKYPAELGESWPAARFSYRFSERRLRVLDTVMVSLVAKRELMEVPAGTFPCHVYKFTIPQEGAIVKLDVYTYFAPGVGMVAELIKGEGSDEVRMRTLLYDYHIQR